MTDNEIEAMKRASELEEKLLQLIDNRDDFTRSDLQAIVSAFVMTHCKL